MFSHPLIFFIFTYLTALVKTNTCLITDTRVHDWLIQWGTRLIVCCQCTLYSIPIEKCTSSTRCRYIYTLKSENQNSRDLKRNLGVKYKVLTNQVIKIEKYHLNLVGSNRSMAAWEKEI